MKSLITRVTINTCHETELINITERVHAEIERWHVARKARLLEFCCL